MKKQLRRLLIFLKYFVIVFFASSIFFVVLYKFVNPPVTPLMLIRLAEQSFGGQTVKLENKWISIDKMTRNIPRHTFDPGFP